MGILHIIIPHLAIHLESLLGLVAIVIVFTFFSKQTHRVPSFRSRGVPTADLPAPDSPFGQLAALGFKPVATCDASMSASVSMMVDVYLSNDGRCLAAEIKVRNSSKAFSFVEFDTNLLPHGNITTNNNNQVSIFYRPPDKMIAKVPWKRNLAQSYALHQELCETAMGCGFTPVPVKPEDVREHLIRGVRNSLDDQVKCGRLVKVSEDVYRASFKGTLIFVPLIFWHRLVYGPLYHLLQPSNRTLCNTLRKRLQQARQMREPYSALQ